MIESHQCCQIVYDDPELYSSSEQEDVVQLGTIYAYPLKNCGAFAFSLVSQQFQYNNSDEDFLPFTQSYNKAFTDNLLSFNCFFSDEKPVKRAKPQTEIETSEVKKFWEIYNDYPRYLKAVKKRNRKKGKKTATTLKSKNI